MPKTTYVWDELSDNVIEEYEDGVLSVSYEHSRDSTAICSPKTEAASPVTTTTTVEATPSHAPTTPGT